MSKYVRLVGIAEREPEEGKSGRQDPALELLAREAQTQGIDLMAVKRELITLELYGVKVTPEIMAKVIARVRAATEPRPPMQLGSRYIEPEDRPDYGRASGMVRYRIDVVYYMRIGNRVKIGTTTNLTKRLGVINPEELMATEPGNTTIERRRHNQFKELRTHGEWFKLEGDLLDHIATLQAQKP